MDSDAEVAGGWGEGGMSFVGLHAENLIVSPWLAEKSDSLMHDVIIASSFLAMLIVPCLAALQSEVSSGDAE